MLHIVLDLGGLTCSRRSNMFSFETAGKREFAGNLAFFVKCDRERARTFTQYSRKDKGEVWLGQHEELPLP